MVFSSILFLFQFLPVVLAVYYVCQKVTDSIQAKNLILFLCSLFFYAWGEPIYVVLMIFSTVVDFYHGSKVEYYLQQDDTKRARRHVIASVVINLSLLGFFKYTDFILGTINAVAGTSIPLLHLPLPIGISFYTFQTMSYTIDIYRGQAKAQKNMISFGAYVALFPQLIAGPIVRYQQIADELVERHVSIDDFAEGIEIFIIGLGKKVLIANNVGAVWDKISVMQQAQTSVLTTWIGVFSFFFQIYFDFSGYSDMAIGLGRMFGFHFPKNFDYPYMSKSITEFWRKWHMTLGIWFREYVYIPLGGNRNGRAKQLRNIFIVWALTGIWHGASWNFCTWGLYFGVLLVIEKFWIGKWLAKAPSIIAHIYTVLIVAISWVIFAFDSLKEGAAYLGTMFGAHHLPVYNKEALYLLATNGVLLLMAAVGSTNLPKRIAKKLHFEKWSIVFYTVIMILSIAYLVDASYNPFLYFRF